MRVMKRERRFNEGLRKRNQKGGLVIHNVIKFEAGRGKRQKAIPGRGEEFGNEEIGLKESGGRADLKGLRKIL